MQSVKVCAVGDGTVGKTCLLISYTTNCFPQDYAPTVFDNYSTNVMYRGGAVHMTLWDTAGQDEYKDMRPLSYPDTNVFLVCFAVNNPVAFNNVAVKWLPEILSFCPNVPFILVGTKLDLRSGDVSDITTTVSSEQGETLSKKLGAVCYMECSALTQDGLQVLFEKAVDVAMANETDFSRSRKKRQCIIL